LGELKKNITVKKENYLGIDISEKLLNDAKSLYP
jgi:hypothetical protein